MSRAYANSGHPRNIVRRRGHPMDLARVQAVHEHRLVITTYIGLNWHHVVNVLRETGLHNTTPSYRKNLSILSNKTGHVKLQRVEPLGPRSGADQPGVHWCTKHPMAQCCLQ